MTIEEYFSESEGAFPKAGVIGVESQWIELCTLEVPRGSLWAGDPWVANAEDGCVVKVTPGTYEIHVKGMDFDGHRRTSRVRALLQGAKGAKLEEQCGETGTDVAMLGLCDIAEMDEAVTPDHADEFQNDVMGATEQEGMGCIRFEYGEKSFEMIVMPSGLGDGVFAVYPLKAGGKNVGVEVEFLPPGFKLDKDIPMLGGDDEP